MYSSAGREFGYPNKVLEGLSHASSPSKPFGKYLTDVIDHEKGRAVSLEPEKKRQRDELASNKGETQEQGTGNESPAVCYMPSTPVTPILICCVAHRRSRKCPSNVCRGGQV